MATTRIKDISKTTTDLASDTYGVFDGATNGTQKMARNDMYADWAAAYVAAPTTYKLAPLNSGTNKIDATYLPTSGDTPKGEWNASTNSPSLADGSGTAGDYYDVTTAGSQDLGSGSIAFTVGDVVKYNGSTWYKIDSVANFLDGYSTAATSRAALEVNSIDEDAQANALKTTAPALHFNGSSSYVEVADDDKLSFTDGTDDLPFSVSAWVKSDDWVTQPIVSKWGTTAANREWFFFGDGSGYLALRVYDTSGNYEELRTSTALTSYEGEWVHVCATYGGAGPNSASAFTAASDEITLYVNGVAVATTADSSGTYLGMSNTSQALWIGSYGSNFADGSIRDCKIFNRELTSTEIAQLARGNDLGFSEEWGGALGGVYTQDATPSGEWSAVNGADSDVAGPITGRSNVLGFTIDNTSGSHYLRLQGLLTIGKRYRVSFDYNVDAGNDVVDGIRLYSGAFIDDIYTPTAGTWNAASVEFVATSADLRIYAADGATTNPIQDAGGDDIFYIDGLTITEIGTLADFRAEDYNESASKLLDRSSNNFVGVGTSVTLTGNQRHISADTIDLKNLPTSSAGLSAGEVWSNSGVLTVV